MFSRGDNSERVQKPNLRLLSAGLAVAMMAHVGVVPAGPIIVPNGSFESPASPFVSLNFDSWQRTPQPAWWDENASGPWNNLTGIFKNTAPGSADHIVNCDGNQAIWLFANPEAGFFQDYDSVDWNDPEPAHAFDARFEPGNSYRLTLGVIGGGYNMLSGTPLEASLYYRDAASNKVIVAVNTIIHSAVLFNNRTQLVYFEVTTPVVRPGDAWAGRHIGIQFLSTVSPELAGGYWDIDNVRLTSLVAPAFIASAVTNGQFQFTLQSEPGVAFEILASTNLALPPLNWMSLGRLTNETGTMTFVDTAGNFDQRFYQVRQVP
jgi:hypothetical protein